MPELAEEPVVEVTQGRGLAVTVGASTVAVILGRAWARDGSECPDEADGGQPVVVHPPAATRFRLPDQLPAPTARGKRQAPPSATTAHQRETVTEAASGLCAGKIPGTHHGDDGHYVEVIEAVQRDALDSMGSLFLTAPDPNT